MCHKSDPYDVCCIKSFLKPHSHIHSQTYFVMCDHLKILPKKMSNIQNQHKKTYIKGVILKLRLTYLNLAIWLQFQSHTKLFIELRRNMVHESYNGAFWSFTVFHNPSSTKKNAAWKFCQISLRKETIWGQNYMMVNK